MLSEQVDIRLPPKGNSNCHSTRPVHQIISKMKWIRTSRLSIKTSLSHSATRSICKDDSHDGKTLDMDLLPCGNPTPNPLAVPTVGALNSSPKPRKSKLSKHQTPNSRPTPHTPTSGRDRRPRSTPADSAEPPFQWHQVHQKGPGPSTLLLLY